MTEYRTALTRLFRRWKSGAITASEFEKRRAALKKRHAAQLQRGKSQKRRKQ